MVIASGGRGNVKEALGSAAAGSFETVTRDRTRVGLSCGFTLYLVGVGLIGDQTPIFCSPAESYGISVGRLRPLGVVGEINYQPFDGRGAVLDEPELRVLMRRILSVEAPRLQALSRREDRHVVAVAGGGPRWRPFAAPCAGAS